MIHMHIPLISPIFLILDKYTCFAIAYPHTFIICVVLNENFIINFI